MTSAAQPFRLTDLCPDCRRPVGPKHRETCTGPPEPECDCGPGWLHDPFCHLVTGKKRT